MRLSLRQQFLISTLGLTLTVLVATLVLARWSFERGFGEYVDALERNRLEQVAGVLLDRYDSNLGWAQLSRVEFQRALRATPDRPRRGDGPRNRRGDGSGPPRDGPGQGQRGGRPPPGAHPPGEIHAIPTALFDRAGQLVQYNRFPLGELPEAPLVYPLTIDGETVGELRSLPRRRLARADESAFVRRQGAASISIFVAATALSILLAIFLTRRLTKPLGAAQRALSELAAGNYGDTLGSSRRDELGDLIRDIDALSHTLEKNQGARRRWIADISHELRTPIAVLKGELDAIADGVRPFGAEQLQSLQAEVARLTKLVDDLYELSLADMGALRYEFADRDVSALVQDLCDDYQGRVESAGLAFSTAIQGGVRARIDGRRLEQLLRNLLENSIAYTDAPGRVELGLAEHADWVEIVVEDSAPGVVASQCEQLFEPLYRQDASRSRRSAGAGLGLAICRAVVEAHKGEIHAQPSDLGGLRVIVRLPRGGT